MLKLVSWGHALRCDLVEKEFRGAWLEFGQADNVCQWLWTELQTVTEGTERTERRQSRADIEEIMVEDSSEYIELRRPVI